MTSGTFSRYYLLLLPAVLLAFLAPLLFTGGVLLQHDGFASDLLHSHFPLRVYLGEQLAQGVFPLWLPELFSGTPFLSLIEAGALFPPNIVLFTLFEPFTALNLAIALAFVVGGLGAFLLARDYGADTISAALAGLVFALCGFNVSHAKHLLMHDGAALLPWLVLFLEKTLATGLRRWPLLLACGIALQVFAGHPQIAYSTLLFLAARFLAHLAWVAWGARAGAPRYQALRDCAGKAAAVALALALGIGLAGIQLVTTYRFTQYAARGESTWQSASEFPYPLADLVTFIYPHARGSFEAFTYQGTVWWENYGYFGLLPLLLAVASPFVTPRRRVALFYLVALAAALVLVAGPATPLYHALWQTLPGMKTFRFPTRFLLFVGLAAAVLAALAATQVARLIARRRSVTAARTFLLLLFLITAADLLYWQSRRMPVDRGEAWQAGPVAAAVEADGRRGRIYTFEGQTLWLAATQNAQGFRQGFQEYRAAWQAPFGNASLLDDLPSAEGYTALVSQRTANFWMWTNLQWVEGFYRRPKYELQTGRLTADFVSQLNIAHVRYLVMPADIPLRNGSFRLLWSGAKVRLFENTTALPRAYLAYDWQPVPDIKAAATWLYDPAHNTIPALERVSGPPAERGAGIAAAGIERISPQEFVFRVRPVQDCYLVWSDSHDPGWRAEVDGKPAEIHPANGYQMAVFVPKGATKVAFRYRPVGFRAGLGVSFLSALVFLFWAVAGGRLARRFSGSRAPSQRGAARP